MTERIRRIERPVTPVPRVAPRHERDQGPPRREPRRRDRSRPRPEDPGDGHVDVRA